MVGQRPLKPLIVVRIHVSQHMKNSKILLSFIFIAIVGIIVFSLLGKTQVVAPPAEEQASILGCYVARIAKDVYTMHLESKTGDNVSGTLDFKNFQKDSSTGSFAGTYQNRILLGDYSFRSEGMDSVMQVIFKKSGDDFIRGFGEVTAEGNRFSDLNNITYDPSSALSLFKKEACIDLKSKIQ